jgi:hypothetical protein
MPNPKLIATFPTHEPAVAVSRGLDRDRVVDETGNQTVVFGRRGSRPFHLDEMEAFYKHYAGIYPDNLLERRTGDFYEVEDAVLRNGQLETRASAKLGPSEQFKSAPEIEPSHPIQNRLIRRGQ